MKKNLKKNKSNQLGSYLPTWHHLCLYVFLQKASSSLNFDRFTGWTLSFFPGIINLRDYPAETIIRGHSAGIAIYNFTSLIRTWRNISCAIFLLRLFAIDSSLKKYYLLYIQGMNICLNSPGPTPPDESVNSSWVEGEPFSCDGPN